MFDWKIIVPPLGVVYLACLALVLVQWFTPISFGFLGFLAFLVVFVGAIAFVVVAAVAAVAAIQGSTS